MIKGTNASPGIALGKALILEHKELEIESKYISKYIARRTKV
jgi:Phosphoenolpyruvate-protein kinase (PTS system EI component in bacteria)